MVGIRSVIIHRLGGWVGGGITWFSGGTEGDIGRHQQSIKKATENWLPINCQWGRGGGWDGVGGSPKNIIETYGGSGKF